MAVIKLCDFTLFHGNFYVAKKCTEIHWALPKEKKYFHDSGDNTWLSILYWTDVFDSEDGSADRECFCFHMTVASDKKSARVGRNNQRALRRMLIFHGAMRTLIAPYIFQHDNLVEPDKNRSERFESKAHGTQKPECTKNT